MMTGDRDLILSLAERLYICSRLLTCAAERLGLDAEEVLALVEQLRQSLPRVET
jgi:hypothetical protein